jgi:hypothetical protein
MEPEDFGRKPAEDERKPKRTVAIGAVAALLAAVEVPPLFHIGRGHVVDRSEGSERADGRTADEVRREIAAKLAAATKRAKRRARRNKEAAAGGWS